VKFREENDHVHEVNAVTDVRRTSDTGLDPPALV